MRLPGVQRDIVAAGFPRKAPINQIDDLPGIAEFPRPISGIRRLRTGRRRKSQQCERNEYARHFTEGNDYFSQCNPRVLGQNEYLRQPRCAH